MAVSATGYGYKNSGGSQAPYFRQHVRQRNLKQPKTKHINNGRRACIARAIKSVVYDHTNAVKNIAGTDDAQGLHGNVVYSGLQRKYRNNQIGTKKEEKGNHRHKNRIVLSGRHYRLFGTCGIFGTQVLPHQCSRSVRNTPGRQYKKHHNTQRRLVPCRGFAATGFSHQACQKNPAARGNYKLQA